MQDFDSTHAIFAGMGSMWWRVVVLFLCCWVGHFVGQNCATASDFIKEVLDDGPSAILHQESLNIIWVPLSWLGTLLVGCREGWGVLQLAALGTAMLFVWLSEDRYVHGFGIASITQPIDSFLVAEVSGSAFTVGLVILGLWVAFIGFAYWWVLQQLD